MKNIQGLALTIIFWVIAIFLAIKVFTWLLKTVIFWAVVIGVGILLFKLGSSSSSNKSARR